MKNDYHLVNSASEAIMGNVSTANTKEIASANVGGQMPTPSNSSKWIIGGVVLGVIAFILYLVFAVVFSSHIELVDWTEGLVAQTAGTETWAGAGTKENPYILATATDLAQLAVNVNAGTTYQDMYLTLGNRVNLGGKSWTAIGTATAPFMGNFDGKNNSVWYMSAVKPDVEDFGFFGFIENANISNIRFFNPDIVCGGDVGVVAGEALNSNIASCAVLDSEEEYGKYLYLDEVEQSLIDFRYLLHAGGSAASGGSANISKKSISSSVSGSGNAGGICGYFNGANEKTYAVYQCVVKSTSVTSSDNDVGGIVGELRGYATNMTGSDLWVSVGACLAYNLQVTASKSGYDCGGIVGYIYAGATSTAYKSGNSNTFSNLSVANSLSGTSGKLGAVFGNMATANSHGHTRSYDNKYISSYSGYGEKDSSGNLYITGDSSITATSGGCTSSSLPSVYSIVGSYSSETNKYPWSSYWVGIAPTTSAGVKTYYYPTPSGMTSYKCAAYTENVTYTISYTLNSGTAGSNKPTSYTYSTSKQTLTVSNPTRSSYDFDGWTVGRSGTYGGTAPTISGTTLTIPASSYGNITLTASWTASSKTFYVYAYYNTASNTSSYSRGTTGGSVGFSSSCGYSNTSKSSTSSSLYRYAKAGTGYSFDGWYSSTSFSSRLSSSTSYSSSTTSLYAKFSINSYTLTINPNGGTLSGSTSTSTASQYYGTTKSLGTPTRTGYTFAGWSVTSGYGSVSGSTYTYGAGAGTVTASWTANTYTVTLDKQSGSGGTSSVTATYGSSMPSATAPTRTGYTFGGYYTSTGGSGTQYYTASMSSAKSWDKTSATTLYAKWTINSYTVTVASSDSTMGSVSGGGTVNYNSTTTITATPNTGYEFVGWKKDTGTSYVSTSASYTPTITADCTYTAYFQIKSFAITASAGNTGGTVSGGGSYNYGSTATITATPSTDYLFDYWVVDGVKNASTSTTYSFTVSQEATIQAYFKPARFMVMANAGGEVRVNGGDSATSEVTFTAVPFSGYYLIGWFIDGTIYQVSSANVTDKQITLAKATALGKVVEAVFSTSSTATPTSSYAKGTSVVVCASVGGQARINGYASSDTTIHLSTVLNQQGYNFVGWYEYGGSTALSTNWSVDLTQTSIAGKIIYAKFDVSSPSINDDLNN